MFHTSNSFGDPRKTKIERGDLSLRYSTLLAQVFSIIINSQMDNNQLNHVAFQYKVRGPNLVTYLKLMSIFEVCGYV